MQQGIALVPIFGFVVENPLQQLFNQIKNHIKGQVIRPAIEGHAAADRARTAAPGLALLAEGCRALGTWAQAGMPTARPPSKLNVGTRNASFPLAPCYAQFALESLEASISKVPVVQETRVKVSVRVRQPPRDSRHVARVSAVVADASPSRMR